MPPKIRISIKKRGIPPGMVLLEDDASLSSGLHDSLARLIQRQLGFPWRSKLRGEAKRLTRVVLTSVTEGSGVLNYQGLQPSGVAGRYPSGIAAFDLVSGIKAFSDSDAWPPFLPAVVRNRLGAAVAPVMTDDETYLEIDVEEDGMQAACVIRENTKVALQNPEQFSTEALVHVVGAMTDLNLKTMTFKLDAGGRSVTVEMDENDFRHADSDELRWNRLYVSGLPRDEQCKTVHKIEALRLATDEESNGVSRSGELRRGERAEAYRQTLERSKELLVLENGWNSFSGPAPSKRTMAFALHFLRDSAGVLLDHGIEIPVPFLVPTSSGGVQFEWHVEGRELELEIPEKGRFEFLRTDGTSDVEGEASRWTALRLLRWVITGEEI
jgi:hypothetical protein